MPNNKMKCKEIDELFKAMLSLENIDECYDFFEDICTVKEINDMAQRLNVAQMLIDGKTYGTIETETKMSSATISRINRCIQYGNGGYSKIVKRIENK